MATNWKSTKGRNVSPRRWSWILASALALGLLSVSSVSAQATQGEAGPAQKDEAIDSRWLPWLGCWQLYEEELGEPDRTVAVRSQLSEPAADGFTDRVLVCLTPAEDGLGVDVTTVATGMAFRERTIRADGVRHPTEESDCLGWQRSEWSRGGHRLFTRSELACEDTSPRSVSGVSVMARRSTWVDIQVVEAGGRQALAVRRYRRASDQMTAEAGVPLLRPDEALGASTARLAIAVPLTLSDVIEASGKIEPEAVEAVLVETEATFDLDSKTLITLDEAAVPESVIDLMVALSFPDHFAVDRPAAGGEWPGARAAGYFGSYGYLPYNDWYPYYVTPFGYSYWWAPYDPFYVVWPGDSYLVRPNDNDRLDQPTGRAVSGRGYTRVRPREVSSDSGSAAKPRGFSSADVDRPANGESSSGRSSGGSVTKGGYTRGGSAARGAKPKNP